MPTFTVDRLTPGQARVSDPNGSQGFKEYVPVNAEHAAAIAAGKGSASEGVTRRAGLGQRRTVRFNCTYDVMDAGGNVTQVRAGHERTFNPKRESMATLACEGIRFQNPTFEQEALAINSGRVYPTHTGWKSFKATRLQPELPKTFGVRVGGR